MSTSDLRGVGISAPTGFVHVSGYNRNFSGQQRCGSVSESSQNPHPVSPAAISGQENFVKSQQDNLDGVGNSSMLTNASTTTNSTTSGSQPPSRDHSSCSRSRMRELSNIDPKFTSQVSQ